MRVIAYVANPSLPELFYGKDHQPDLAENIAMNFAAAWQRRRLLWIGFYKNRVSIDLLNNLQIADAASSASICHFARLPKELIQMIDQIFLRMSISNARYYDYKRLMRKFSASLLPYHLVPMDKFHRWNLSMIGLWRVQIH